MKTEYAICYCKDKASKTAVVRIRRTLQEAKPEGLLDSSYFVPWLFPARWRLFAPVSYTERPASAAAKLCEGKIIILVNGSPSALVLPSLSARTSTASTTTPPRQFFRRSCVF